MKMLDTCICIYTIKKHPENVIRKFQEELPEGLCISSITLAELCHGVQKSSKPKENQANLALLLTCLTVIPFDDKAANEYGKISADLQKKGPPIGTMDMLIAAHAKSLELTLVTNNIREFAGVNGLELDNWI